MPVSFKGGLHIKDFKSTTEKESPKTLPPCDIHYFPIKQHIGSPLKTIVKTGDAVKVGQKLADAEEFMSVPVHSSISGTVKDICNHITPSGEMCETIIIENDKKFEKAKTIQPVQNVDELTTRELLWLIRDAGIIGLGGAGFPTHVKLSPKNSVKYLIVNGAECEPFITSDHRAMLEETCDIIYGIKIAMRILNVKESYIGIETNKRNAIDRFKQDIRFDNSLHIIPLKTKYPQGAEKQLIKAVTGRNVPTGKIPADVGCVVINAGTALAIAQAVKYGIPLTERIVTVSGDDVVSPGNFKVPTGVPISFVFDAAGGFIEPPKKIIVGGPMMGKAQYSLDAPVTKTTSSVLAFADPQEVYDETLPCIRCGTCVKNCPMNLMPNYLSQFGKSGNADMAEKYHITDCIECGLCSYVCPAKQHTLQNIQNIKPIVLKNIKERGSK